MERMWEGKVGSVTKGRSSVSIVDTIIEMVKDRIRVGLYAPGQRLIAAEIQHATGSSRGPVREALRRLAAEGIVEFPHNKGARVRAFSTREMVNAFGVREALEGYAARLAAARVDASHLRDAFEALEAGFGDASNRTPSEFRAYNSRFHALLLELAGNEQLAGLVEQLSVPVFMPQFFGYFGLPRAVEAREEHRLVARAVLGNDPDGAEAAMRAHIRTTRDYLLQAVHEHSRVDLAD